jgi:plasmid stabilization system protein ParE
VNSFQLTPSAARDLEEILEYVAAETGGERAESVRCDLISAMHRLAQNPGMGHTREDLTERPVLFWSVHSWMIVYRGETRPLQVLRVLSGWRDVSAILRWP